MSFGGGRGGGGGSFGGGRGGSFGGPPGGGGGGGFGRQAAVKSLKEAMQQGHKTGLPPSLLKLFEARPKLPVAPPPNKRAPKVPMSGIAGYLNELAAPGDPDYDPPGGGDRPPSPRLMRNPELPLQARVEKETRLEKRIRISKWKQEEAEREVKEALALYDPSKDPKVEGDPFKTLIVARLSYDVTEKKLKREFEEHGPIKRVRVVYDKAGKHRGYAFIEYEHKKDMKEAYKLCDGKKIEGRRIVVDVERGRTVEGWRPRRLGGGLGGEGRVAKLPKKAAKGLAPAALNTLLGVGMSRPSDVDRSRERERERPREEPRRPMPPPPIIRDERPPRDDRPPREERPPRDEKRPSSPERRERERKREREGSPVRRDRERDEKRRHMEDGEVRDPAAGRIRERERSDRDRPPDRPRRERDAV